MYSPRQSRSRHPARHSRHDSRDRSVRQSRGSRHFRDRSRSRYEKNIDLHAGLLCHRECMNFDRLRLKYAANGKHQRVTMTPPKNMD